MEEKTYSRYRFVIVALTILSSVAINLINLCVTPINDYLAEYLSVDIVTAGYTRSVVYLCMGFGSLGLASFIIGKFGNKKTMILSFAMSATGNIITLPTRSFILFLAGRAVFGLAAGVMAAACMSVFAAWLPKKENGIVVSLYTLATTVFVVILYMVEIPIYNTVGIRGIQMGSAIFSLLFLGLWVIIGRDKAIEEPVQETGSLAESGGDNNGLKLALASKSIWYLAITYTCMTIIMNGVSMYLPSYMTEIKGMSAAQASNYASFISVGSVPGMVLAGLLVSVVKKRKFLIVGTMGVTAASIFMFLTMDVNILIIIGLVTCGLCTGGSVIPVQTMVADFGHTVAPQAAAGASAMVFGFGNILTFFLPVLLSGISGMFGFGISMFLFAALGVLGCILSVFIQE